METTHLENFLKLFVKGNVKIDESLLNEIEKINFEKYLEPCLVEFKKNIISKETKEGKIDIIKYYIIEIAPYTIKVWFSPNITEYVQIPDIFIKRLYNNYVATHLATLILELDFICKKFDIDFKELTYNCNVSFSQFYEFGTKPFKTKIFLNDSSKNVGIPEYIGKKNKTNETIEPEPPIGKITAGQKYYLLEKLGLFDNGLLKGNKIKIEDKQSLVSKLLDINIRTARAFMNNDEKYIFDPNKKKDIDNLLKKITNSKG
jgi:hypothetical protein